MDRRFMGEDRLEQGADRGLIERGESPLADTSIGSGCDDVDAIWDLCCEEPNAKLFGFSLAQRIETLS